MRYVVNDNSKIGLAISILVIIGLFVLIPFDMYPVIIFVVFIVGLLLAIAFSAKGQQLFSRGSNVQRWEIGKKEITHSEQQEPKYQKEIEYREDIGNSVLNKLETVPNSQKSVSPNQTQSDFSQFQQILLQKKEITINEMALELHMKKIDLFEKLIKWSEQIPFTIIKDKIVVTDLNKFIEQLDEQFQDWDKNESIKAGKITIS
ncbi:hypothetical protein NEF87_000287 [Candidatus Lokiarchaeum ossiferum]|uniref:Helix-turn-helix domain-containing protein n=1 Tax=Candidatus Lokiarchaeum ossiferum TaxID=2951803 RepID=A0ABY6HNM1_9ARCH|nr:hypothetical protein NEF87_000287 [Candidatus Lokiarchaeum sp. B-35]